MIRCIELPKKNKVEEMSLTTGWIYLLIAGILEMIWATGLKYTDGMSKFWPTVGTLIAIAASVWFLAHSLEALPLGTAYAAWTGIGAVSIAIIGIIFFHEPATLIRIACIGMILAGVVGLKIFS